MNDLDQKNDLLESRNPYVKQHLNEKLIPFTEKIGEIEKLYSTEEHTQTIIDTLQQLLISLHEIVINKDFSQELTTSSKLLFNQNNLGLLYNIFIDTALTDETRKRAFKIIAIAINTNYSVLDYISELTNPFDFFNQFFNTSSELFPPCCICMFSIATRSSYWAILRDSPIFEETLNNLKELQMKYPALNEVSNTEEINKWKGCVNLLFEILNHLLTKLDHQQTIEKFDELMALAEGFFEYHIQPFYDSILRMILQMCNVECTLKANQDESKSEIINRYNMLPFLCDLLSNPEFTNLYSVIITIFIRNYPFEGDFPFQRILEIFLTINNEKITNSSLLLFQEMIRNERAIPEEFYNEDFLQHLIDISNEFSSLTSQYDAELILLILTYTPIDNIEHIIENEEFGEIVLSVFEGENDRTTHLITLFIRFMESMTTQGIQPETNLANFIDALQEPISELSDSEDVDIRLWAGTALKEYYYEEYRSKYHTDDDNEKIVIRIGHPE